jgi:hypothetical protein
MDLGPVFRYCCNGYCSTEATTRVTIEGEHFFLCETCYEAFEWGCLRHDRVEDVVPADDIRNKDYEEDEEDEYSFV